MVFLGFLFFECGMESGRTDPLTSCESTVWILVRRNYFSRTIRPWEEHRCPPLDTPTPRASAVRPLWGTWSTKCHLHFQIMLQWSLETIRSPTRHASGAFAAAVVSTDVRLPSFGGSSNVGLDSSETDTHSFFLAFLVLLSFFLMHVASQWTHCSC